MEYVTYERWDPHAWKALRPIYETSFPREGTKTERMLQGGVERGLARLHAAWDGQTPIAMAYTGSVKRKDVLLIDYLAVAPSRRGQGAGRAFLDYLKRWAIGQGFDYLLIEAEAGEGPEYEERRKFWERNGFASEPYVHQYIWVPEPYQAMTCSLREHAARLGDGPELFRLMGGFHGKVYRGG